MPDSRIFFKYMHSRVLHIDSGSEWRGGQRQLFLLALEQRKRGTEPLVVGQPRSRLVMRLRASGVASSGVRMRGRWDLNAVRRIRRLVRMWHPQIIHVHDPRAHAIARKALVGLAGVVLIVNSRTVPRRATAARRPRSLPARFVAPNRDVVNFLTNVGVPASIIDLVPPAVPEPRDVNPRSWRTECRWPRDAVVCGVVGLSPDTGDKPLSDITRHLGERTRSRLRFVILGEVGGAGETTIAETVAFAAGFVDDIAAAVAGLDIVCNLSGAESMSTALLDAMALGVPPVTYDSAGASEYVAHGECGLVVSAGDAVAFAAALSSLVEDEEMRDTFAAFGPGRAADFSVPRMAEAIESTYARALGIRVVGEVRMEK